MTRQEAENLKEQLEAIQEQIEASHERVLLLERQYRLIMTNALLLVGIVLDRVVDKLF